MTPREAPAKVRSKTGLAVATLGAAAVVVAAAAACGAPTSTVGQGGTHTFAPLAQSTAAGTTGTGASAGQAPLGAPPVVPPSPTRFDAGVTVHLDAWAGGGDVVSFGLPLPLGAVTSVGTLRVRLAGGKEIPGLKIKQTLAQYDKTGAPSGVRAVLIQFPRASLGGAAADVEIAWRGGAPVPSDTVPFDKVRTPSPQAVEVAEHGIEKHGLGMRLFEKNPRAVTQFEAWEPRTIATFPLGYLAHTKILGEVMAKDELAAKPALKGATFLSENLTSFVNGSLGMEGYRPHPKSIVPSEQFESWLYDRCATLLLAYAHAGDTRHLRSGLRTCSYYSSKIELTGPRAGIFSVKPDPDPKYSHLRGLYAYYALTGDDGALAASRAMADMWEADKFVVEPYRKGYLRGPDKLWTERHLSVAMEAGIYGFFMTGNAAYLRSFRELFETAYRHITTSDKKELEAITKVPGLVPQNCLVHTAAQHAEGAGEPWCSGWMAEMLVDPMLRYQAMTGDDRVDEVFVRLARSLRDVGTMYFRKDVLPNTTFFKPGVCFAPESQGDDPRILAPNYGFGLDAEGKRKIDDGGDVQHCADATALTAAALRSLKRQGKFEAPGPAPFKTEGDSFYALHQELLVCSLWTFLHHSRHPRDPRQMTPTRVQEGWANGEATGQDAWIERNKIGWPVHEAAPSRKLSWWFNTSMLQFSLLEEAGIQVPELRAGYIQDKGCRNGPISVRQDFK